MLDMVYRIGAPHFHELTVAQARQSTQKMLFAFRPEAPPVTDVPIPRPNGSTPLVRYYHPLHASPDSRLPVLVYRRCGRL